MQIVNRVLLKSIQIEDLPLVLSWRNQDNIKNVMYNSSNISKEQHTNWFENLQKTNTAISKIFYFDGIPYGVLNVNQINLTHNSCEWGFYIGESTAPRGMGIILGYTGLNYIFNEMHIRKVNAEVIENNPKSREFHKKLGFKHDGTLRKHIFKDNQYMDIDLYSIFHTEWKSHLKYVEQKMKEW